MSATVPDRPGARPGARSATAPDGPGAHPGTTNAMLPDRPGAQPGARSATASGRPARHGSIELIEPACTSCMICARECPSWCITIDSHTEPIPDLPPGARERTRNVLDRFVLDWSLCMYCGICVDECPFDALEWVPERTVSADAVETLRQHWRQTAEGPQVQRA